MLVAFGDLRVGAGDADGGDTGLLEYGGGSDGHGRAVGAQHHGYALIHQLRGSGGRLIVGGLVIHLDQLDLVGLAADLHGGLDAVGVFHAQCLLLAAGAVGAGSRLEHTDLDDIGAVVAAAIAAAGKAQAHQCRTQNDCEQFFHMYSSLEFLSRLPVPVLPPHAVRPSEFFVIVHAFLQRVNIYTAISIFFRFCRAGRLGDLYIPHNNLFAAPEQIKNHTIIANNLP